MSIHTQIGRLIARKNLLKNHPEGLDKHIGVIPESEFRETYNYFDDDEDYFPRCWSCGQIPFLTMNGPDGYLIVLGADIVTEGPVQHKSAEWMRDKINSLSFYMDQVHQYLSWRVEAMVIIPSPSKDNNHYC